MMRLMECQAFPKVILKACLDRKTNVRALGLKRIVNLHR